MEKEMSIDEFMTELEYAVLGVMHGGSLERINNAKQQIKEHFAALEKDAARYRYLRNAPKSRPNGPDLADWTDGDGIALRGTFADEAIDAAIAAEK
jgi:hypothetical protein